MEGIVAYIGANTVKQENTYEFKQYSSGGNKKDFLPFVSMQDLSSLLKQVPAQHAVCYTTYMLFFYLQQVCILLPLGNSFCLTPTCKLLRTLLVF